MAKYKVFVDGNVGTTGMQIEERLKARSDIELLTIPEKDRKDPEVIKKFINDSDITFLCLPDAAAREAVELAKGSSAKIIDASTAHRTNPDWCYGFSELGAEFKEKLKSSKRVAVPGCHASGFISLIYPLVKEGVLSPDADISATSLTGYSGGGKKLIEKYEGESRDKNSLKAPMPYALSLSHKHLPEMTKICSLTKPPVFLPVVGDYYKGMLVSVPLNADKLSVLPKELNAVYEKYYGGSNFVKVMPFNADLSESGGFLNPELCNDTNELQIYVFSNGSQVMLCSVLDNLGKGSGGAAVQCMNIMLGIDETTSLK